MPEAILAVLVANRGNLADGLTVRRLALWRIYCDFRALNKAAQTAHLEAFVVKVRIAVSAILAIGLALGASGCNLIQPQATTQQYDPSDGIGVNVGEVQLRNLILISDDGETASLLLSAINTTDSDIDMSIQFMSQGAFVTGDLAIPSSQRPTSWGAMGEDRIIFEGIDTVPGSLLEVYFQYGNADGKTALVPVLTTGQPEYEGLEPSTVLRLGTR